MSDFMAMQKLQPLQYLLHDLLYRSRIIDVFMNGIVIVVVAMLMIGIESRCFFDMFPQIASSTEIRNNIQKITIFKHVDEIDHILRAIQLLLLKNLHLLQQPHLVLQQLDRFRFIRMIQVMELCLFDLLHRKHFLFLLIVRRHRVAVAVTVSWKLGRITHTVFRRVISRKLQHSASHRDLCSERDRRLAVVFIVYVFFMNSSAFVNHAKLAFS
mmetsp:Transcript_61155/g.97301  ORF Transcript_61155/g.97301 Transcript_61155/m.97301 type:complete len:213 (+) Transcript_61155:645-1283(+)